MIDELAPAKWHDDFQLASIEACGLLDCGENLITCRGITFVPLETEEHSFSNLHRHGERVLVQQERFNQRTRRVSHGALHDQPLFFRVLHEHRPVPFVHWRAVARDVPQKRGWGVASPPSFNRFQCEQKRMIAFAHAVLLLTSHLQLNAPCFR